MSSYYEEFLVLKTTQEKLIESGIIRAVEALSGELSVKVDEGSLTIKNIRSLYNKIGECLHTLDKAQAETQSAQKSLDEYNAKNKE